MNTLNKLLGLLAMALAAGLASTGYAEKPAEEAIDSLEKLKEKIADIHQDTGSSAVGIALVEEGELAWLEALGQANAEHQVPATPDTLFRIGSTSKMFVALAVLKLVEEGRVELNAPLSELAPSIEFTNPWEDEHPVRLVHLLEHTTGWHDMRFIEYGHNGSQAIALGDALTLYPGSRESRWVPGTRMAYFNTGSGVAAYVVEKITGMAFEDYVQREFFTPLGMANATYFKPEDFINRAATPYQDHQPQDYWHILYRPAGAINASPREMAKLLQFFLQRGEFAGRRLLKDSSIDRMETPQTTLANPLGVTSGYGLANYTRGFKGYGLPFHGHNGGMPGAYSEFFYAPELNSGLALMLTGNPQGLGKMADAVREYLLRGRDQPDLSPPPLPQRFKALDGVYKPINPRQEALRVLPTFLTAMTFSSDGSFLHRMPMTGGWDQPSSDYILNDDRVLVDQWTGLPHVAIVQDPLAGEALQAGRDLYKKTSAMLVWGELLFFVSLFTLSALALIYALAWVPINAYRKTLRNPAVSARIWPTLASLLLLVSLARMMTIGQNLEALKAWSSLSITLFTLTLGYGLTSMWSAVNLFRLRRRPIGKTIRVPAWTLSLLHLAMTLYLASYGMIGLQIWTW